MTALGLESLFSLAGRHALVTGGSAGIGKMIAAALLLAGAEVSIVGRRADVAGAAARELSPDRRCRAIAADVTMAAGIGAIRSSLTGRRLDILVNNAGLTVHAPFESFPGEMWDSALAANVKAPFMLTQALYPLLKESASPERPSHVINIGSCAGITPKTKAAYSYYTSKAALHHLTRILAFNFAKENVNVNAIAPGYFKTEMIAGLMPDEAAANHLLRQVPMGRFGSADDVAGLVIAIATSRYMSGNIIPLDGGFLLES